MQRHGYVNKLHRSTSTLTLTLTLRPIDVGYLTGIIKQFGSLYPYNRSHVHALGQSNGAAMVYRLGCEAAEIFASVTSALPPPSLL